MSAYIYLVVLKPTGQRYFGCRWANVLPPEEDLWQEYFTSSKYIKELIEQHGKDAFSAEVVETFDTPEEARQAEHQFITENDCVASPDWINRGSAGETFYNDKGYWGPDRPIPMKARSKISKTLMGHKRSLASRNKQSETMRANPENNHFYGRRFTDESNGNAKPIVMTDEAGKEHWYPAATRCIKDNPDKNFTSMGISMTCSTKYPNRVRHRGCRFRYA